MMVEKGPSFWTMLSESSGSGDICVCVGGYTPSTVKSEGG